MSVPGLGSELHAIGIALGLLDDHDNLRSDWFSDPLAKLKTILIDPVQRAALLDAIDGMLPEDPDGPADSGETWHPLIDDDDSPAQVFITLLRTPGGEAELGLAARVHGKAGAVATDVTFKAGLVHAADGGLSAVLGTPAAPLRLDLDLTFDRTDLGFDGVRVDARVAPPRRRRRPPTSASRSGLSEPTGRSRARRLTRGTSRPTRCNWSRRCSSTASTGSPPTRRRRRRSPRWHATCCPWPASAAACRRCRWTASARTPTCCGRGSASCSTRR